MSSPKSDTKTEGGRPDASCQSKLTRRGLLLGAGALGFAAPFVLKSTGGLAGPNLGFPSGLADSAVCKVADSADPKGPLKKINLAWNAGASCLIGVTVAKDKGFFTKHGLDVELINFSSSTDQLLETIATGKADAAVGMALRWLKPLEQGFDVKIVGSTHGGCLRLLAPVSGAIKSLKDLKGKTVAVSDMNSPAKNFFSVRLKKVGIDPVTEVDFRQFPGPLLRAAVEKGEAQALADNDPITYLWTKDGQFAEISSNLTDEYASRVCCIIGVRGTLLREDKPAAASIVRALIDAADFAHHNPEEAAETYLPFAAGKATKDDLATLARYHTHGNHLVGAELKKQLALYAEELRLVNVIKPSTDIGRFAERIYADVLT
jgi:NitT/TauT family transport system substrate-binding protein